MKTRPSLQSLPRNLSNFWKNIKFTLSLTEKESQNAVPFYLRGDYDTGKPNLYVFSEMKMYFVTIFRRGIWRKYHKTQKSLFF